MVSSEISQSEAEMSPRPAIGQGSTEDPQSGASALIALAEVSVTALVTLWRGRRSVSRKWDRTPRQIAASYAAARPAPRGTLYKRPSSLRSGLSIGQFVALRGRSG
jgi:hypothetical protein